MTLELILGIVSALLAAAAAIFGTKFELVKKKVKQVVALLKEAYEVIGKVKDLVTKIDAMLADDRITEDEVKDFKSELAVLKEELVDVKVAFLALFGKEVS